MKIVHFVSGLPRACSTLLCNLLAQNPRVHATPSSPVNEICHVSRGVFKSTDILAMDPKEVETIFKDFQRAGILNCYHSLTDRPVVVDKSRGWIGGIERLFQLFPNAKVLVPIRDVRGIISSMEKKYREHPFHVTATEAAKTMNWTTVEKRVQGFLNDVPLGIALERLYDAQSRFKDKLHFVSAEKLTTQPEETMKKVWEYLEEKPFVNDFNNIEQYTKEHEIGWPYGDHSIANKIVPLKEDWDEVLGKNISELIKNKFQWVNNLVN